MLIGLAGAAGCGKNTVADIIADGSPPARIAAFADPIYECVSSITGISVDRLQDRAVKEAVLPWLGKSPRQLLQLLGTEWGRQLIHPDIWVRSLVERVSPWLDAGMTVVVTDVRFDNEAEAISAAGGEVWKVVRPGWSCLCSDAAAHASEAGVGEAFVARTIVNDGGLDRLRNQVCAAII